jgi:hypothetical protein
MDGLFLELGPLRLVPGGAGSTDTLKVNPYSWHNVGNLVFIDQPIGCERMSNVCLHNFIKLTCFSLSVSAGLDCRIPEGSMHLMIAR